MSISILLNDIREFDHIQFESFATWAKDFSGDVPWFKKHWAIEWSFYVINAGIFFLRAYLIYAIYLFVKILNNVENDKIFYQENSELFKKIGNIFIYYIVSLFILKFILALISQTSFKLIQEFRVELTVMLPADIGLYVLATVFEKAKALQDENDLTV